MKAKKEMFETEDLSVKGVRINKFLADAGVCSRREADAAIEAGLVTIDGEPALMGSKVLPGQKVTYKGKDISKIEDLVLIAFNKPVGIVCTTDRRDPDNIIDFISYEKRIFPIGRLDKDSEGLILLTNDGNIVNKILRAGNFHEKEYVVKVNKEITPEFLSKMAAGVPILDTVTRPCTIEQVDKFTFRIILTQGLNRQIRRMCEALDYRVRALQRVRIMNITLGRLKTGTYRNVTDYELAKLKELISDSSNTPTTGDFRESEGEVDEEDIEASKDVLRRQAHRNYTDRMAKKNAPADKKPQSSSKNGSGHTDSQKTGRDNNVRRYDRNRQETKTYGADRASKRGSQSIRTRRSGDHK